MTLYDTPLPDAPLAPRPGLDLRELAAAVLRAASRALDGLALRLTRGAVEAAPDIDCEFYAEAGAAEGALYVNGQLVARLPGVTRL